MVARLIMIYKFFKMLKDLDNRKKTSIYRMIYWKTHWDGIPPKEKDEMLKDGWMRIHHDWEGELSYRWSPDAEEITKLLE